MTAGLDFDWQFRSCYIQYTSCQRSQKDSVMLKKSQSLQWKINIFSENLEHSFCHKDFWGDQKSKYCRYKFNFLKRKNVTVSEKQNNFLVFVDIILVCSLMIYDCQERNLILGRLFKNS